MDDTPTNRPGPKLPRAGLARLTELLAGGVGVRSFALTVLMLLAVLYTLYFARPVILPVVIALLLSMLLVPLVRFLHGKLRMPVAMASGVVLAGLIASLIATGAFAYEPASAWIRTIPTKIPELKYRIKTLQKPFEKVTEASEQMQELTAGESRTKEQVVQMKENTFKGLLMRQTPALMANLLLMFVLLYFMLASGDLFLRKVVSMVPTFEDKRRAVEIAREIEEKISTYLRTVTVINLGLGLAVGAAAGIIGLGNYVLWGALAFVLNFVPYLGALIGIVAALVVSLLTFESTAYAFVMPGVYLALNILEGNFITPMILGRILTLNPVVVFIAIMFWAWIWGVWGALLAVPILAVFKIVCDRVKPLAPLGELVGGEESAPA